MSLFRNRIGKKNAKKLRNRRKAGAVYGKKRRNIQMKRRNIQMKRRKMMTRTGKIKRNQIWKETERSRNIRRQWKAPQKRILAHRTRMQKKIC